MLSHKITITVSLLAVAIMATSCAQMRKTNRPAKGAANHMFIKSDQLDTSNCTRGMFLLTAEKDRLKGRAITNVRGFVSGKIIPSPNPLLRLGLVPKSPSESDPEDVAEYVGPIEVDLGDAFIQSSNDFAPGTGYAMVLKAMKGKMKKAPQAKGEKLPLEFKAGQGQEFVLLRLQTPWDIY